ncbi:hypothetical protein HLY00_3189 [Mycolicibacterium hippocampi]|uniref:Uncharacterized protein n=1 Tax=Mycolicibacterium hippocampi TaxID=659824 RepID=A0A850PTX5_9MYCO|nr:hypothetical protein [Mycolicibacterium hippocampi]
MPLAAGVLRVSPNTGGTALVLLRECDVALSDRSFVATAGNHLCQLRTGDHVRS